MSKTFIIAEAGVNHNGSLKLAKELVDVAVQARADAVKFQTFKAENLASKSAPKAEYQKDLTEKTESQLDMLKRLELTDDMHQELLSYCQSQDIQFMSTAFDLHSLDYLLKEIQLPILKISSGDITNGPLLVKAAQSGKDIIISTGMGSLEEVQQALAALAYGYCHKEDPKNLEQIQQSFKDTQAQELLKKHVSVLHCTTEYPTPYQDVNLAVMDKLKSTFGLTIGLSDHTPGIAVPLAAVARGAQIIEKHFTLDKSMEGPDHKASLDPTELKQMVQGIRQVEQAIGTDIKKPAPSEIKNMPIARKSLVAHCEIRQGDKFSQQNLTVKRPGTGANPMMFWNYLGKEADKTYQEDEVIE